MGNRRSLNRRGVHDLTAAGWTPKQIATWAGISVRTVYNILDEQHALQEAAVSNLNRRRQLDAYLDPEGIHS